MVPLNTFILLSSAILLVVLFLKKVMGDHDALIAASSVVAVWLAAVFGILLDRTDFPESVRPYYIAPITIGTVVFSCYYFYWKAGHPLVPTLRKSGLALFTFIEMAVGLLGMYGGLSYGRVFVAILNPPLEGNLGNDYLLVIFLMSLTGVLMGLGAMLVVDSGIRTAKAASRRPKKEGEKFATSPGLPSMQQVPIVQCFNCKSRYLASADDILRAKESSTHTTPCVYCNHPATVIEGRI